MEGVGRERECWEVEAREREGRRKEWESKSRGGDGERCKAGGRRMKGMKNEEQEKVLSELDGEELRVKGRERSGIREQPRRKKKVRRIEEN